MKAVQHDMTSGSPMRIILSFTFPIFLGNVFQQFYNMADAVIVGKFVGTGALAAVGSTGTIMFLIYGFVVGMTAGFTVLTAQKFGAGDMRAMRKTVSGACILSLIIGVILTAAFMLLMKPWLELMNTPDDIFGDAYSYIMIISAGILAQMLYNLLASILRALGNSRVPLYFLILSALLNIVLDLVLIIFFHMGTAGAAVATVISQGVSGLLCMAYIVKEVPILRMCREDWHLSGSLLGIQLRIGIPMALQYSITAIGSVILQASVNTLGSMAVAAVTAGTKISNFMCCPFDALGSTMATYGGQNVGARKLDRVDAGLRTGCIIGCVYAIAAFVFLWFFGKWIILLFVDAGEADILHNTQVFLLTYSAFYIPLVFVNAVRFMIQGLGYSKLAVVAGVCEMAARSLVGFFLVPIFGYQAVCFASPAAWICADLFLIPAYRHVMRELHRLFGQN